MCACRSRISWVCFVVLLFILVGCSGPPAREGVTPAQAHMYAHYDRTKEVHDALVRGYLEGAKDGAHWLATHQDAARLPEGSAKYSADLRTQATEVREASDLPRAAMAAAQMAGACGDCHREYGIEPRFLVGAPPPAGSGAEAEMALHVWASERMWNGLVGPDDFAWSSGASALKMGWLSPHEMVMDPQSGERVRALIRQVYQVGIQANTTSDPHARAELYGDFLTTCIDCHQLTGAIIR